MGRRGGCRPRTHRPLEPGAGLDVEVALGARDGLPRDCAANLDHVQTVPKANLGALIAVLPLSRMDEVRRAVLFALGFGPERSGH